MLIASDHSHNTEILLNGTIICRTWKECWSSILHDVAIQQSEREQFLSASNVKAEFHVIKYDVSFQAQTEHTKNKVKIIFIDIYDLLVL